MPVQCTSGVQNAISALRAISRHGTTSLIGAGSGPDQIIPYITQKGRCDSHLPFFHAKQSSGVSERHWSFSLFLSVNKHRIEVLFPWKSPLIERFHKRIRIKFLYVVYAGFLPCAGHYHHCTDHCRHTCCI